MLAVVAAAAAIVAGAWTGAALRHALLPQIHWTDGLVDWRLVAVIAVAALVVAAATGVAPARAMTASAVDLKEGLPS